jgi:cytohesin
VLAFLCLPVHAEEADARKSVPYPGLLVALPMESGITVRWVYPPLEPAQVKKASLYDLRMGVDAAGAPWFGFKGDLLQCPEKALLCATSRPFTDFVFTETGSLIMATSTDWGYLAPSDKPMPLGKRPPTATYQPVATLPVPRARLFAGQGSLFFAGQHPETGKYAVYALLRGDSDPAGPIAYTPIFTSDEPITAVAGALHRVYIAVGDIVFQVSPLDKTIVSTQRVAESVRQLACEHELLYYATYSRVGVMTDQGAMELMSATDPRIAVRDGTLYVALPETLGVLALDHAAGLAAYDLRVSAEPAGITPTVKLTDVRCFEGGEETPASEDRQFSTTFTRAPGRFLYVQAHMENLRRDREHTDTVRIVAARENGGVYFQDTVTFHCKPEHSGYWGWVRFGTAKYPPYPGAYTITTYLNGAKADTRTITITGSVSAVEAATNFDVARLAEALKRGESANAREDGIPLLVKVAGGYNWSGSTPEERKRRTTEVVRLLVKYKADVKARDSSGDTALHQAAWTYADNAEVITMLLKAGADVNARNNNGYTPLRTAMLFGNTTNVRTLLVKGIDLNIRDKYECTALHEAVKHGHLPVVEMLLAKGANPALADKYGETALFAAATDPTMLQAVLNAGADPHATAMIHNRKRSLLGHLIENARWGGSDPDRMAQLRMSAALLLARGADLLPEECHHAFGSPAYRLFDQAALERALARDTEMSFDGVTKMSLMLSESLDDPTVQRAVISYLLAQSRLQVSKATSVVQYQKALEYCTAARKRMQDYLKPTTTWIPEVLYNCALLEAHLGDFSQARDDLTRYLELAPKAKDAKQVQTLLKQYAQQEAAMREPIAPAALVGIWWPDGDTPDREKFFRLEFALRGGQLQARVLAQAGWEASLPVGEWVSVTIRGNHIEIDDAIFRTSTSNDYGKYTTTCKLTRVSDNRLIGEVGFNGKMLKDGEPVGNSGTYISEWRRRK